MSPTQEMVMTLFNKNVIENVRELFRIKDNELHFENFDISFRLFKPTEFNVNLEVLAQTPKKTGLLQSIMGVQELITFFKPVGFYTINDIGKLEITILGAFENDLDYLVKTRQIQADIKVNTLALHENAVIAAFSIEAVNHAEKYIDTSFFSNGLDCDIFMSQLGYPQMFLNDKYRLEGPIAAYLLNGSILSVNPILQYKQLFDLFNTMSLLTMQKKL